MKQNILIFFSLLFSVLGFAADEQTVNSTITEVSVFRQRAMITREASAKVVKGDNLIIFTGLSKALLKNSITVSGSGTGSGVIQSVTHRINYLNLATKPPRMIMLEDSLIILSQKSKILTDEKFVYENEQQLILGNNKIGGNDQGLTALELQKVADLYRDRLLKIRKEIRDIEFQIIEIDRLKRAYQQEISQITAQRNQPTQEVVVAYNAENAGTVKLALKYLVNNANWNPFYDIRVENTSDPLKFFLKANVVNNTGIDWNQVKLRVSTTNNNTNNNSPVLNPWYVDIARARPRNPVGTLSGRANGVRYKSDSRASNTMDVMPPPAVAEEAEDVGASYAYEMTTTSEGELGLEFVIALPYDIPADGKEHQVDILLREVKGDFRHFAVPKLDRDAFLVAYINEDLLRGKANVYFEGTFVGETYVDTDNPNDSMKISLGRDPKVQVQWEQVRDYTDRKVIGTSVRQTYGFDITLKNNKSEVVNLTIEDQIPVSQNKDIEIKMLEASGGEVDELSGKVVWNISMKPGETRKLNLRFEAKYPKNRPVSGL